MTDRTINMRTIFNERAWLVGMVFFRSGYLEGTEVDRGEGLLGVELRREI